jgi:hypothetical protein
MVKQTAYRLVGQRVVDIHPLPMVDHQPGPAQPGQVLGDIRLALPQPGFEMAYAGFPFEAQLLQNLHPERVPHSFHDFGGSFIVHEQSTFTLFNIHYEL